MEKLALVVNGLLWDAMKLLGCHMTTEKANRKQEKIRGPEKGCICWSKEKTGEK
jgi:hypothetical protein